MKHRLRHPIRQLTEPFGKAGLTVAICALVLAMVGGAYAAGGLTAKQKKEVKAIAKSFQGTGPAGAAGANGTNGKDGAPGAKGEQGIQGVQGVPGNPAEYPKELASGQTEVGAWSLSSSGGATSAISFPIPLSGPLSGTHVHFASNGTGEGKLTAGSNLVTEVTGGPFVKGDKISGAGIPAGTTITSTGTEQLELSAAATASAAGTTLTAIPPAACPGSAQSPEAVEGSLCLYVAFSVFSTGIDSGVPGKGPESIGGESGAGPEGIVLLQLEPGIALGTWAVTAE